MVVLIGSLNILVSLYDKCLVFVYMLVWCRFSLDGGFYLSGVSIFYYTVFYCGFFFLVVKIEKIEFIEECMRYFRG